MSDLKCSRVPGYADAACSMDKLFDLMMMGFKYQILCSTRVEQVQQVSRAASLAGVAALRPARQLSVSLCTARVVRHWVAAHVSGSCMRPGAVRGRLMSV